MYVYVTMHDKTGHSLHFWETKFFLKYQLHVQVIKVRCSKNFRSLYKSDVFDTFIVLTSGDVLRKIESNIYTIIYTLYHSSMFLTNQTAPLRVS